MIYLVVYQLKYISSHFPLPMLLIYKLVIKTYVKQYPKEKSKQSWIYNVSIIEFQCIKWKQFTCNTKIGT